MPERPRSTSLLFAVSTAGNSKYSPNKFFDDAPSTLVTLEARRISNTGGYSNVIGVTLQLSGTATNVNGSNAFQFFGHFNPAGTEITIGVEGNSGTETGTLTKQ